jgi:hypothetical protein
LIADDPQLRGVHEKPLRQFDGGWEAPVEWEQITPLLGSEVTA